MVKSQEGGQESFLEIKMAVFRVERAPFLISTKKNHNAFIFRTEIFWINTHVEWKPIWKALENEILKDPLLECSYEKSRFPLQQKGIQWWCIEKRLKAGVTDNAGLALKEAIELVAKASVLGVFTGSKSDKVLGVFTGSKSDKVQCASGHRLWLGFKEDLVEQEVLQYAKDFFYNELIEDLKFWNFPQAQEVDSDLFLKPQWFTVNSNPHEVEHFNLTEFDLSSLQALSQKKLWALSIDELKAIQKYFLTKVTDVEMEILAQTWSEHCKHKIFAAQIEVENLRSDMVLPLQVDSLFKTYIRGATEKNPAPYLKSVFEDNAGIFEVTSEWDCAVKVETHNSPSALDPYGGALTGIVGVNRDILGAGMGAEPIANLDVFCVGPLDAKISDGAFTGSKSDSSHGMKLHHPRRILEGVRLGVEHGGNKSGIPTVTGAVEFHPGFLGKPLVFCGTVGLLPKDRNYIQKKVLPGDQVVMAGGRIGKDGIHGATFSSLQLDEASPVSAVQLGDPLTQKRLWDFLIEARNLNLFNAVTDNGAGGLSSSVGEMARLCGKNGGAKIDVALAKTKYPGLSPYELVISESQERMTFAVPKAKLEEFLKVASCRNVECSVLGEFLDSGKFEVEYQGKRVACLDLEFLHDGVPQMKLKAKALPPKQNPPELLRPEHLQDVNATESDVHLQDVNATESDVKTTKYISYGVYTEIPELEKKSIKELLPLILSHPLVCSRRPIVQRYDHEVQARTIRKPYGSIAHSAPGDGATLCLSRETYEGLAIGVGLAPRLSERDPKIALERSIDEALRNAMCAGLDPSHAIFIDNFCWPDPVPPAPDAEEKCGALVVTCQRLFEAATELEIPFISGKDSMKNDYQVGKFRISVPPTILITAAGKVQDVRNVPFSYALKQEKPQGIFWVSGQPDWSKVDFLKAKDFFKKFHSLVLENTIVSAHDVSDGGWLCATAEILFGTGIGAEINLENIPAFLNPHDLFNEPATSFVLLAEEKSIQKVFDTFDGFFCKKVGALVSAPTLTIQLKNQQVCWEIEELERAYESFSFNR